jgi:hypothetical protein
MENSQIDEVDVFAHSQRGGEVPHGKAYRVRIDREFFRIDTARPTGELLLSKVRKRSCAFELIEEFCDGKNDVVEPNEEVDLRRKGLQGFITAHKEIVTIFIGGLDHPFQIERGQHTVAQILAKVDKTTEGYVLLEEKDGPPLPVPPNMPVKISGCEMFYIQPQSGGSS